MKFATTLTAMLLSTASYAGPNASAQIAALPSGPVKSAMTEMNNEDQRTTDGSYNRETGTLTLYTQDMNAGADGDISRRAVVIDGMAARDGADGADGVNGINGVNGADGINGVNGADGINGVNGADGINGADGRDFDAASHIASLAASTALGGLQFHSLTEGETGWAAGIGGQFEGDAAFAIGLNHALTDNFSANISFASTFKGDGASGFIGVSGKF